MKLMNFVNYLSTYFPYRIDYQNFHVTKYKETNSTEVAFSLLWSMTCRAYRMLLKTHTKVNGTENHYPHSDWNNQSKFYRMWCLSGIIRWFPYSGTINLDISKYVRKYAWFDWSNIYPNHLLISLYLVR
jgi:hypothetical protein